MSLDKAMRYGKEKRKPYRGAKAVNGTCRNHGSCGCIKRKQQYKDAKRCG